MSIYLRSILLIKIRKPDYNHYINYKLYLYHDPTLMGPSSPSSSRQGMGRGMRPSFWRSRLTLAPAGTTSLRVSVARMERVEPSAREMGKGTTWTWSMVPGCAASGQNPYSISSILTLRAETRARLAASTSS